MGGKDQPAQVPPQFRPLLGVGTHLAQFGTQNLIRAGMNPELVGMGRAGTLNTMRGLGSITNQLPGAFVQGDAALRSLASGNFMNQVSPGVLNQINALQTPSTQQNIDLLGANTREQANLMGLPTGNTGALQEFNLGASNLLANQQSNTANIFGQIAPTMMGTAAQSGQALTRLPGQVVDVFQGPTMNELGLMLNAAGTGLGTAQGMPVVGPGKSSGEAAANMAQLAMAAFMMAGCHCALVLYPDDPESFILLRNYLQQRPRIWRIYSRHSRKLAVVLQRLRPLRRVVRFVTDRLIRRPHDGHLHPEPSSA